MGKLLLIRHGESTANREKRFTLTDDVPLTDVGREQARAAGQHLAAHFRPAVLLSSHFARARETANIIAADVGLNVVVADDIHERSFGLLRGEPYSRFDEMAAMDPAFDPTAPWDWTPAGGESRTGLQVRVLSALRLIANSHPDEEVLVVCHGAVIQAVWAHLEGGWETAQVPKNCGIVIVEVVGQHFSRPSLVDY